MLRLVRRRRQAEREPPATKPTRMTLRCRWPIQASTHRSGGPKRDEFTQAREAHDYTCPPPTPRASARPADATVLLGTRAHRPRRRHLAVRRIRKTIHGPVQQRALRGTCEPSSSGGDADPGRHVERAQPLPPRGDPGLRRATHRPACRNPHPGSILLHGYRGERNRPPHGARGHRRQGHHLLGRLLSRQQHRGPAPVQCATRSPRQSGDPRDPLPANLPSPRRRRLGVATRRALP